MILVQSSEDAWQCVSIILCLYFQLRVNKVKVFTLEETVMFTRQSHTDEQQLGLCLYYETHVIISFSHH